ncbi:MAG: oligoendopeptidase F [bacterium]|nr:oligoendopeptidase F [bacterium]
MKIKLFSITVLVMVVLLPVFADSKASVDIPDYSMTERKDIPVEYTWNVEDLYPTMQAWEKNMALLEGTVKRIPEMSGDWTSSAQKMAAMMDLRTELLQRRDRLYAYVNHQANSDLGNQEFQALKGNIRGFMVRTSSELGFINSDILALGDEKIKHYLKEEPKLKPYAFYFQGTLRMKKHILPEEQEKIVSLTGLFGTSSGKVAGILNNVELPHAKITLADGKEVALNYANYARYRASKNRDDRAKVLKGYWENSRKFENTFAALLDAGMKQHLFKARVKKHEDCLSSALYGNNIDTAVYHNLIKHVSQNLAPFHRYLKIRKELLGVKQYKYEDMYVSAVKSVDRKFPFAEAEDIILKSLKPLGKNYTGTIRFAFDNRWIDRYPNKDKQSGAYSGNVYRVHPYIKMNYDGSYSDMSTLTHELGHALHSYFADLDNHFVTSDYPNFLAEIASTFNEVMLVNYLLENEKDDMLKLFILDAFLQGVKGSIYRQTQFSQFELAMHRRVEEGHTLTAQWLNKEFLKLCRTYYGHDRGIAEVGDYIRSEWSGIPHFFLDYYVYTYSTGMIASMALTDMVLKGGKAEREKYLNFLKTGGSRYPLDNLKTAGVDMTTAEPFNAAFRRIGDLVSQMEAIVRRLKKAGKL